MGRRGPDDEKWAETKERLHKRDKGRCRLLRVISAKDATILRHRAGSRLSRIDAAHFRAVSELPAACYELANVVCLNRYSHECLDSCKDPIYGASISKSERDLWWIRILHSNRKQFEELVAKKLIPEELLEAAREERIIN